MNPKEFTAQFDEAMGNDQEWKDWQTESVYVAVTLDKPVYKPGDKLQARVLFFNITTKEPVVDCGTFYPTFTVLDGQDSELFSQTPDYSSSCTDASLTFDWEIPEDQTGGLF